VNDTALLCREIIAAPASSQHDLAARLGWSVGTVNRLVRAAQRTGYLDKTGGTYHLTPAGRDWMTQFRVDNAIILAAGFGSRFVPLTYETPKGLIKVQGVPMIERQIEQLRAAGVTDITVVVGYLKEKFDYLIDTYGVRLVYNPEYKTKNNFASLYHAREHLRNTYILVADHWIDQSVFHEYESESWQSCAWFDHAPSEWQVTVGPYGRITKITSGVDHGWAMMGPAFFDAAFSATYRELLEAYYTRPGTDDYFWEHIVKENLAVLPMYINRQPEGNVREFETFEDLRAYDPSYLFDTNSASLDIIAQTFGIDSSQIKAIKPLKDGMTNLSFLFQAGDDTYVFRQPGAGTDLLIDRQGEKTSYELVAPLGITDEICYFDGDTGVKISRYYAGARVSGPFDETDVRTVMALLRTIHEAGITPKHRFDIAERIDYYEGLATQNNSITFADYEMVRRQADELLAFRRALAIPEVLCHIDYVYTNILHLPDGTLRVIDWEYSGAADPLIDVAMYAIYAIYNRSQMDAALRHYLGRAPTRQEEARLYLYVALGGFLWSLWTEYKQGMGDEFGQYSLDMYRYMKDYYRVLTTEGYLDELGA